MTLSPISLKKRKGVGESDHLFFRKALTGFHVRTLCKERHLNLKTRTGRPAGNARATPAGSAPPHGHREFTHSPRGASQFNGSCLRQHVRHAQGTGPHPKRA